MNDLLILSTLLIVLAWILSKQSEHDGPPLFNNEGISYYNPNRVLVPSTLFEIQNIVNDARKEGRSIRPLGSGHTWSTFSQSDGIYVSLYKYRGLVKLDKLMRTASFKGGTLLWEINSILAKHDLGLSILPSISNQTIAGAIATGTHGSGVNFGHLSSYVTNIQLVTGTGEVLNVSSQSDSDLFQAAGVSVGLLGIITQVTLNVEPIFNLHETTKIFTLAHCIDNLKDISTSYEHVKLWIELASGSCCVFGASRTKQPPDAQNVINQPMTNILNYGYEVVQWFASVVPCATNLIFKTLFSTEVFPQYQRIAVSWDVFNIPHYIASNHREAEVAVPIEKCVNLLQDLIKIKTTLNIYINHIVEVRFVKKDKIWLSNSYNMDTCHVTLLLYNPSDYNWKLYTDAVFAIGYSYGGRPHWGKSFNLNSTVLRELYPKFEEFLKVQKSVDPNGVFLSNTIIKETFGIS